MGVLQTYADDATGWRGIEAALPAELRTLTTPREAYFHTCGVDVHLDLHGDDGDRTRVVLLHGGGGHGRMLAPIASRIGVAAIAPDLPGYGLTDVPNRRMRYPLWVEVAASVIAREAERAERLVVAGFSMGGLLALHALALLPANRAHAVLVTTLLDPRDAAARRQVGRFPIPPPALLRPFDNVRVPIGLVAPLSRMANDRTLARAVAADEVGAGRAAPLGFWRTWLQYDPAVIDNFDRAPVTLAHPAADRWTPLELSAATLTRITRVRTETVLLPGGGHFPVEPQAANALETKLKGLLI